MLIIFLAALAPALLLMWYVYHKDFNPEPKSLIFKGFFYGALSTFVSSLISLPLYYLGLYTMDPSTPAEAVRVSFLGAAVPEECAKLLMLWLLLRNCREFDERYDGIVYAVAVGLGFAAFENLQYVLAAGADWYSVSISRAIFAVPGHFGFAVLMGYYYSLYHFHGDRESNGAKYKMLLFPILLHGIYDTIVFSSGLNASMSALFSIVLIAFCFFLFRTTRRLIQVEADANKRMGMIERDSAPTDDMPDDQLQQDDNSTANFK